MTHQATSTSEYSATQQTLTIKGMTCASCQIHVQKALQAVPGVDAASVNLMAHTAQITSTSPLDPDTLITAVRNSGYDASLPSADPASAANMATMDMEGSHLGLRTLVTLIAGAVAMLLSMPLMMSSGGHAAAPSIAPHLAHWVGPPCPRPSWDFLRSPSAGSSAP